MIGAARRLVIREAGERASAVIAEVYRKKYSQSQIKEHFFSNRYRY